jgi:hypothetical protein
MGPATQPAVTLAERFNSHVEVDLMFYHTYIIFHMIDRCTRWHQGSIIANREETTLLDNLDNWIQLHGAMNHLYVDGEPGLNGDSAKAYYKRKGIIQHLRAPGQHARYIERRGALLRYTMHVLEQEAKNEGVELTITRLLAESIFAGNALTFIGGRTPYQAVYGRQPAVLPDLPIPGEARGEDDATECKVRTLAIQAILQATNAARVVRSLRRGHVTATSAKYKVGQLVDYFREGGPKDVSHWRGPARVVAFRPEEGQVVIDLNGRDMPCRLQDVRHTLLVLFVKGFSNNVQGPLTTIVDRIFALNPGRLEVYGHIHNDGKWQPTKANEKGKVLAALSHFAINAVGVDLDSVVSIRIGRGIKQLPRIWCTSSTIVYWTDDPEQNQVVHSVEANVAIFELHDDYKEVKIIQFLHGNSECPSLLEACDDLNHRALSLPSSSQQASVASHDGERLSTISEHPTEEDELDALIAMEDSFQEFPAPPSCVDDHPVPMMYVDQSGSMPIDIHEHLHYAGALSWIGSYATAESDERGPYASFYLKYEPVQDCPTQRDVHEVRVYASGYRNSVIRRENDVLTPAEIREHSLEVASAIREELTIWHKYGCFARVPRRGARNLLDSRFVTKFKILPDGKKIIRARLAIRGFKDEAADEIQTYSAVASRTSQRILVSECAARKGEWELLTLDINKAFLQGYSYEEMSNKTGEPQRIVHFELPRGAAEQLRLIDGFQTFDERTEVLRCCRPGTGTKDAPRAFSLKLASVTRGDCSCVPSLLDEELEIVMEGPTVAGLMTKHVDDLKIATDTVRADNITSKLEAVFGKLVVTRRKFVNCGVEHEQHANGDITLNQDNYIKALIPITHPALTGAPGDMFLSGELMALFWSLLGAMAYTLLTQHHLAVYVVALQRVTHKPQAIHIRRLNALVRIAQRQPMKLVFKAMTCAEQLHAHSDAGFSREPAKDVDASTPADELRYRGYAMRGANYLRVGHDAEGKVVYHLIDIDCRTQKLVARSTFGAELLAATSTTDRLIPLALTLQEVKYGPLGPRQALKLREEGGLAFTTMLCVDAKSVFVAVTSLVKRQPQEKSLSLHVFWLRELILNKVLRFIAWYDTRDMSADAHTKGSIDRSSILSLMNGNFSLTQPCKVHPPDQDVIVGH